MLLLTHQASFWSPDTEKEEIGTPTNAGQIKRVGRVGRARPVWREGETGFQLRRIEATEAETV
jgi:hypothetical protein